MNWRLTAGRLSKAWRDYHRVRRELGTFQPGSPIFVTGTHRSGTTWIAKMLAAPGLWYIHEPFNPNKKAWPEAFSYARSDQPCPKTDRLMHQILRGKLRWALALKDADHPLMPLRLFPQPIRRIMIKDPLACLLTEYLTKRHDLRTLVVFRHPCGFVSSVERLGWPTAGFLHDLLAQRDLVEDHLSPYVDIMRRHSEADGVPAGAVLHAVLNLVLWKTVQELRLRWCLFESLCRSPINEFEHLFRYFDLPYTEATRQRHQRICLPRSRPVDSYHPHAVERNSQAMADSWKKQLTEGEVEKIRAIWSRFDVPLYRADQDWCLGTNATGLITR